MAAENNLSITIQQLDSNGQTISRRFITASETAAVTGTFFAGRLTGTSQTTVTMPPNVSQARQILVKNLGASGSGTLTVVWTPTTGAEATVAVLGVDGVIVLWDDAVHATAGISSLKLTASIANTDYEAFIGS